jgi:ABC-type nitrate/sulfonate/bicarbonate transport system substrate-binding protein
MLMRAIRSKILAAVLALALMAAACGGDGGGGGGGGGAAGAGEDEFEQVTLMVVSNNTHIAAMVASEQGYWIEQGLDVRLEVLDSGREIMTAVGAGEVEFGGVNAASTIPPARAGGLDVSVFVPYMNDALHTAHAGRMSIIARTDRGIDPDDPSTLEGKTIANLDGSTTDAYLNAFTERHQIEGVQSVNTPVPEMPVSLQQGLVDAVVTWQPYGAQILREMGDDAVVVEQGGDYVADVIGIAARNQLIAERPELVEKLVIGVVRGAQYVRENPEESAEILLNYLSGVELEDLVEGNSMTRYDPRVSVCTEEGVMAGAQSLIDDGEIESEPFEVQELLNVEILNRVVEEHPEYFDDLEPLPETVEDCQ